MSKKITLSEAVEVFLAKYDNPRTRRTYARELEHLMRFVAGGVAVEQIKPFDLQRALNAFRQLESIQSPHTVNKFIKTVKIFFRWCVNMELIATSPASVLVDVPTTDDDVRERTMPRDDYQLLVDHYAPLAAALPSRYLRGYTLILVLGDTSARRAGLAGLRWSDVDFANREIRTVEKGDQIHHRPFFSVSAAALRQWQLVQPVADGVLDAHVFSANGKPVKPAAIGQFFRRLCKAANIHKDPQTKSGWGPHAVRHMVGFRLEEENVPTHIAAAAMGHSIKTYVKYYASADKELVRSALKKTANKRRAPRIKPFPRAASDES